MKTLGKKQADKSSKSDSSKEIKKKPLSKRFNKLKKLEKLTNSQKANRAILYIGHLPKGFNEEQLKGFFA